MAGIYGTLARRLRDASPVPIAATTGGYGGFLAQPSGGSAAAAMSAYGSVGVLFAIVSKLASETASVEWSLQRRPRTPDGEPTEVLTHAALSLIRKPNAFYTWFDLIEAYQQHIDLVGEGVIVVARNPLVKSVPLELWVVRPDRIEPVPSSTDFISGWIYTGPRGEKIPLDNSEVIQTKLPNPFDPYRGLGAVQSILVALDSARYTAEWNRNFFRNSAEPGGIIRVPKRLSRTEFDELRMRWDEQHRGASRAHRVAILENMEWVDRKYTMRDMQFVELLKASDEQIRQAFAFPRPMLGTVDDTNRANMDAAQNILARSCVLPRLRRLQNTFNSKLLPLFGPTADGLEYVFESPVEEDEEKENTKRNSKATAFKTYIDAGVDPADAAEVCELPPLRVTARPTLAVPQVRARAPRVHRLRDADLEDDDLPNVDHVQASWEFILAGLLAEFGSVVTGWFDSLVDQVRALAGHLPGYSGLAVPTLVGTETLTSAMSRAAREAAEGVVAEAVDQGVTIPAGIVDPETLRVRARVVVEMLGQDYATSAGREAMRVGGDVDRLREHLDALTTARQELYLGHALTTAQHSGRLVTFSQPTDGPVPAYYANETLDTNTCTFCREVHGRWLGNSISPDVLSMYPTGGYVSCKGRQRCRGQVVAVWRKPGQPSIEKEPVTL